MCKTLLLRKGYFPTLILCSSRSIIYFFTWRASCKMHNHKPGDHNCTLRLFLSLLCDVECKRPILHWLSRGVFAYIMLCQGKIPCGGGNDPSAGEQPCKHRWDAEIMSPF